MTDYSGVLDELKQKNEQSQNQYTSRESGGKAYSSNESHGYTGSYSPTVSMPRRSGTGRTDYSGAMNEAQAGLTIQLPSSGRSARQNLLANTEDPNKWYRGSQPTSYEMAAQIYRIGQQDPEAGAQFQAQYLASLSDPSSPYYNPYTGSTSAALQNLSKYGFDTSNGVSHEWFEQNKGLLNDLAFTEAGNVSSARKYGASAKIAKFYEEALKDEPDTVNAENEWAAIQEEIAYLAKDTAHNYSDQEILDRIDWSNYPTLRRMDEKKALGVPMQLNRAIGYSKDNLNAVIWAARNDGGSGDMFTDGVLHAMGEGKQYQVDENIRKYTDPTSDSWNPYMVGATSTDALMYFGIYDTDGDWLETNRGMRGSLDSTESGYYADLAGAHDFTSQAFEELDKLKSEIDYDLQYSSNPDDVINRVDFDEYPALKKMQESLTTGKLVKTTKAIPFDWKGMQDDIRARCAEVNTEQTSASYAEEVSGVLNPKRSETTERPETEELRQLGAGGNVDLLNRPQVPTEKLVEAGWDKDEVGEGTATVFTSTFTNEDGSSAGNFTPIVVDEKGEVTEILSEEELQTYAEDVIAGRREDDKHLKIGDFFSGDDAISKAEDAAKRIHELHETYYSAPEKKSFFSFLSGAFSGGNSMPSQRDSNINSAGLIIADWGSNTEKMLWQNGYEADFNMNVAAISNNVKTGSMTNQEGADRAADSVRWNYFVGDGANNYSYLQAKDAIRPFEKKQAEIDGLKAELEQTDPASEQHEILSGVISAKEEELESLRPEYELGQKSLEHLKIAHDTYLRFARDTGSTAQDMSYAINALEYVEQYAEYKPTEWLPTSMFAQLEGEYTKEQLYPYADQMAEEARKRISEIDEVNAYLEENGFAEVVGQQGMYAYNMQREKERCERIIKDANYYKLQQSEDFDKVVEEMRGKIVADLDSRKRNWRGFWSEGEYSDDVANIAAPEHRYNVETQFTNATTGRGEYSDTNYMSEDERNTYLYLLGTEGAESATEYYNHLTDPTYGSLTTQKAITQGERVAEMTENNPLLGYAMSVVASPTQGIGMLYGTIQSFKGEEINPYNKAFAPVRTVRSARAVAADKWQNGNVPLPKIVKEIGFNALSSGMESRLSSFVSMGTPFAGATIQALGAGANSMYDIKMRGGTDAQANFVGWASTATELITELPEQLLISKESEQSFKSLKDVLVYAAKEAGWGEFKEEGFSGFAEELIDRFIMGEDSEYAKNKEAYLRETGDKKKAFWMANFDAVKDIFKGAVTGFFSGGMSGVVGGTQQYIAQSRASSTTTTEENAAFIDSLNAEEVYEATQDGETTSNKEETAPVERDAEEDSYFSRVYTTLTDATKQSGKTGSTAAMAGIFTMDSNSPESISAGILTAFYNWDSGAELANALLLAKENGVKTNDFLDAVVTHTLASQNNPVKDTLTSLSRLASDSSAKAKDKAKSTMEWFISSAESKKADQTVQNRIRKRVNELMVAERAKQLVGSGVFRGLQPLMTNLEQAKQNTKHAKEQLQTATDAREASGENLQTISAQWVEDPTNAALHGAVQQATKDHAGKVIVEDQMRQSVEKYEAQQKVAQDQLDSATEQTLGEVREQAASEVAAERQARRDAEAQRIAEEAVAKDRELKAQQEAPTAQEEVQARGAEAAAVKDGGSNVQYSLGHTTAPEADTPNNAKPLKSSYQVAKDFAKKLGVGDFIGTKKMNNVPREVLGYYENRANYIAVRPKEAGEYSTTMHEAFHAISNKIGMTGTDAMIANLDPAFAKNYSKNKLPGEAFAEFGWMYMSNRDSAVAFAGEDYVNTFEHNLRKAGLYDTVMESATELRSYLNSKVDDMIKATIRNQSDLNKRKSLSERFRNLLQGMVDDTSIADKVDDYVADNGGEGNLRHYARLRNFSDRVAFNILSDKLTTTDGTVIGDGLGKIFKDNGIDADNEADFTTYMLALHSLDRDKQNKAVFARDITSDARSEMIARMEREHPNFKQAEQKFQQWRHDFLTEYMVKPGFLKEETLAKFEEMYPHYVPTRRVKTETMSGKNYKGMRNFKIMEARGSTEDIIHPMDSMVDMVKSIVQMKSNNDVMVEFERLYDEYDGFGGLFGRKITQDSKEVKVDVSDLHTKVEEILANNAVDDDIIDQVVNLIGEEQSQFKTTGTSTTPGTVAVQRTDGTKGLYQITDPNLFKMITQDRGTADQAMKTVGKLTKAMSGLTTGSNPIFAGANFLRDFQTSVNSGSWAYTYADGFVKWLAAAYDVIRDGGEYEQYKALGGGGWTRLEAGTTKGMEEYRGALYNGYGDGGVKGAVKSAGDKLWSLATLERVNEVVEQTSRYAEYKFGKHDKSTGIGRQKAFLAAQDATVDFSNSGNSAAASTLKQLIPFFNASVQGVYRTGRFVGSQSERSRLAARVTKNVVNTALSSAVAAAFMMKYSSDEEKEDFLRMSDDMKSKHFIFPNFAPGVLGDKPLIRVPLAQDPLTYAVHGLVTNAMWSTDEVVKDETMIELAQVANTILDNMNPVGDTIFQPFISVARNQNWYGSAIVPSYLDKGNKSTQFTAETPQIFIDAGRVLNQSPIALQYLAQQYTGFLGQMAIPALSPDKETGKVTASNALDSILSVARNRFTTDPLTSQNVVSSFYDGKSLLDNVLTDAKREAPQNSLRRGLSGEELEAAYTEAKELTGSKGKVGSCADYISETYKEIDRIQLSKDLTDEEKNTLVTQKRRDMMGAVLDAQEAIGDYRAKYVDGENMLARLTQGKTYHIPTAAESMPQIFQDDIDEPYMRRAMEVYDAGTTKTVLPTPKYTFSKDHKEYTVEDDYRDIFDRDYKSAYSDSINKIKNWEALTPEEKESALIAAHTAGFNLAKKRYLSTKKASK